MGPWPFFSKKCQKIPIGQLGDTKIIFPPRLDLSVPKQAAVKCMCGFYGPSQGGVVLEFW